MSKRKFIHHTAIVSALRSQIVQGSYPPGAQFPTRVAIENSFGASSATIQRALDRLVGEGFLRVNSRQGTFVADHPPHLFRYGLVSPHTHASPGWSRFWVTLANLAADMDRSGPRRIHLYPGIEIRADNENYRQMLRDVREHRLAGIIFGGLTDLTGSPLLEEEHFPCVALGDAPLLGSGRIPAVDYDWYAFTTMALQELAARGRKRVAIISSLKDNRAYFERLAATAANLGITVHPYWIQLINSSPEHWAANTAHLLFHPGQTERPDGLIVMEDNFLDAVTTGLAAAGAQVPRDLDVIAHCNYPWPITSSLPVRRLGFDARQTVDACLAVIDAQRRNQPPAPLTKIQPVFEEDVPPAPPLPAPTISHHTPAPRRPSAARKSLPAEKAFTLVELLVVIAIIAVLMAILIPSLSNAKQQAIKVACGSNMRQCLLSLESYGNEYGQYPCVVDWNGPKYFIGPDEKGPINWNSTVTYTSANGTTYTVSTLQQESGFGLPTFSLLVALGQLPADFKVTLCPAKPPSVGAYYTGANKLSPSQSYFHLFSPDTCSVWNEAYGFGNSFDTRNKLQSQIDYVNYSNSPRGWSTRDSRFPASNFARMICPGFGTQPSYGTWGPGYEPHAKQPYSIPYCDPAEVWPLHTERNVGYADAHVEYDRK